MKNLLAATGLLLALGMAGVTADAKEDTTTPARARQVKPRKPPVNTGYGETRKERNQRLLRECKGRPNAGACEGYAS